MGITTTDIQLLEGIIKQYNPKSVIELGAQNNYAQPKIPAPYMDMWYLLTAGHQIQVYYCVDISGENNSFKDDLAYPITSDLSKLFDLCDLVTDFGTSEHIGIDGKFSWDAIYNCWVTKFKLLNSNGILISENPKTGNWPGHGFNYYTKEFYRGLEQVSDLKILMIDDEICAMGNCETGKNVLCVQQKTGNKFPTLEEFMEFDLRQS